MPTSARLCATTLLLTTFSLLLSACEKPTSSSSSPTTSSSSAPSGGGGSPIKIGHYGSMTGSEATFGVSTDNGIKLAVKERNAAGGVLGRQIQLITYDDQGKSQEVNTAVNRLIKQDGVTALLGEVASSRSIVGGQVAQRAACR
jgi:branched-chain amino acid transport system substrate-binding protein